MHSLKRSAVIVLLPLLTVWLLPGCGSDDDITGTQPTPPDLPPVASFVMDFSDFASGQIHEGVRGGQPVDEASKANWGWAAGNVLVWNTLITVGLVVPVASFLEAFHHEPTRQPDTTWVWDYNFMAQGAVHLAELHGKKVEDEVQWEMHISKEGEYTDFVWYSGLSLLDGTGGTWTLYSSPTEPSPLVGIEWHRDAETQTADIKYTNIVPDGPENGGYIAYGTTTDDPFDAFYDIYNKGLDNHTDIEWNRSTKAGRVKDPNHFTDSEWHCWDSALDDVPCTLAQ
jgi:hypothetical protein